MDMVSPDEYQAGTKETEIYTEAAKVFIDEVFNVESTTSEVFTSFAELEKVLSLQYCTGKLNGEAGEVAELIFKAFREDKGKITDERKEKLFKELGDVLWYVARISDLLGFKLSDVMEYNLAKLADRKERGVLSGSGDDR